MQTVCNLSPARSILLAAGAFLCLITLGGCAGGGGGSSSTLPVPFVYPTSLKDATSSDTVDGFISPYSLDTTTNGLVSTTPSVSGTSPSAGTITIMVNPIKLPLPSTATEPAFSVKFDPASLSASPVLNSPLDSLLTPCPDCLKTVTVNTLTGNPAPVTFTYLDPSAIGLNYSVLGIWEKPTTTGIGGAQDSDWPYVGGAFSAGVLTRGIDLPTTGSASYSGYFLGRYVTSVASGPAAPGTYLVGANASATANFGAGTVSLSTSGTFIAPDSGGIPFAMSGLDLTANTMPIVRDPTSNSFGGNASTTSGLSGPIQGGFYGPPATTGDYAPPELGGSLSVTNGTESMAGSFALKK